MEVTIPDEEFKNLAPYQGADDPSIVVRQSSMLALLEERRRLREALTMAQDRCSRLNEEGRLQRLEIVRLMTVCGALEGRLLQLADEA